MLVNHIPNCELITNKLGLLMSLREYERVCVTIKNKPPKLRLADFHPETYVLDDKGEFDMFCEAYKGTLIGSIFVNLLVLLNIAICHEIKRAKKSRIIM